MKGPTLRGMVKVMANLPTDTVQGVLDYSKERGITGAETILRALSLQTFVDEEVEKGGKLLIRSKNGRYRRVIL